MAASDRTKWNLKHSKGGQDRPQRAPEWLTRHLSMLPSGSALDVATGRGAAAIEMAAHGWQVTAVDISDVGIQLAAKTARGVGVDVEWLVADLDTFDLPTNRFDLITVFNYLDRHRLPAQCIKALKPGGCLVCETFTLEQIQVPGNHLKNTEHMLKAGELLDMFRTIPVRAYREVVLTNRAVASLIAGPARPS